MTDHEAKEILEGIKGYEKTLDLIENRSVSVQDACTIGINAIEEVHRYKQAIENIKQTVNKELGYSRTRSQYNEGFTDGILYVWKLIDSIKL